MPNGNYVNNELEFEKQIASLQDRALLEFVARQNYETCIRCEKHNVRITALENQSKKTSGIAGGIAGTITAIIIGVISYFTKGN
jgi:ribosomal protein L6P/L9E